MESSTAARSGEITPGAKSIEDELRGMHAGLTRERKPETFELPGYGPKLQAEYRVLSSEEQDEIAEKVAEQNREGTIDTPMYTAMVDNLIRACVCLYTMRDGKKVRLRRDDEDDDAAPIRWGDERLAAMFRLAPEDGGKLSARQVMLGVLGDDRLVLEHGQEVTVWMKESLRKIQSDF